MHPSDRLVRDQAIKRHKEKEAHQKRENPIPRGIGSAVVGTVFDCNRANFERLLKDVDQRLYVGWNPFKKEGNGCWEVWYRPSKKTPILEAECRDYRIYTFEYRPNDFEHWVADLDYLSYGFLNRLHEMDMWNNKQFIQQMDDRLEEDQDKLDKAEEESIKYAVRHNKAAFSKLKGLALDGYNPFWFFSDKRQGNGQV